MLALLQPRSRRDGEHGQILILFALMMVVVLGASALVIDVGLLRSDKIRLQNALDAGAMAGAHYLPASTASGSSNYASIRTTATSYTQSNMPGLTPTVTFRCLIGITSTGLPRVTDMPGACNVSQSQTSTAWLCDESSCWAPCDPATTSTDVCNTIQVTDDATRQYGFGGAMGITSGNTGTETAAACSGLCGASPTMPLDVVVVVDRTGSMGDFFPDGDDVAGLRAGARAVLGAYDPAIQRVAFGTLGPSSSATTSPANSSNAIACAPTPAVGVSAMSVTTPGVTFGADTTATNSRRQVTQSGTATNSVSSASSVSVTVPSGWSNQLLIATVAVNGVSSVSTPSGWTLVNSTSNSSSLTMATFYRVAPSTMPGSYSFSWSSNKAAVAGIVAYTGFDTTTPIDVTGSDGTGSNRNLAAQGVTTTGTNNLVVAAYAVTTSTTISSPAALTEAYSRSGTSGPTLEVSSMTQAAAGATGNQTATVGANSTWTAHLFAIRAATSTNTNLTITVPANAAGDVFIAAVAASGGSGATVTAPTGWTSIRRTNNGTTTALATWYHVVTAAETGSYTWTLGSGVTASGTIAAYSGVDTASVLDPSAAAGSGGSTATGSGSSATAQAVTTTTSPTQVIGVYATSSSTSWTRPTGFTEEVDLAAGSSGPTLLLVDKEDTSAGSTGSAQASAGSSGSWAAQQFALRARVDDSYSIDVNNADALASWIPVGFSGTDTGTPAIDAAGSGGHVESYSSNGVYTASTHIGQAINCFDQSGTGTNLATPLDMALKYLQTYGRTGARKGIILETDGAPGSCPSSLSTTICDKFTSTAAQTAADAVKAAGVTLFTIGYGSADPTLLGTMASTSAGTSTCTAAENTDGDAFFCAPTATDLSDVFSAAAASLAAGTRLVQLYPTPKVTAIAPSSGTKSGGTTVTVTGTGFTDAYQVTVDGVAATFQVLSATSIRVTTPARASTGAVDIQVTGPGGSSTIVAADRFTYTP